MMWWSKQSKVRRREELLSAYLDGRLAPRELAKVQLLLETSVEWRRELDSLQAALALLRQAPRPAPPRSFALTPAMAEARRSARSPLPSVLRPAMSVATAAAAVLLAVSLAGGAGFFSGSPATPLNDAPFRSGPSAAQEAAAPDAAAPAAPQGTPAPNMGMFQATSAATPEGPEPSRSAADGSEAGEAKGPAGQAAPTAGQGGDHVDDPALRSGSPGQPARPEAVPWPALAVGFAALTLLLGTATFWLHRRSTI